MLRWNRSRPDGPGASRCRVTRLAGLGAVIFCSLWQTANVARATAPPAAVPAQFRLTGVDRAIPTSFFGLSLEYNQMLAFEDEGPLFNQVVSLIEPEGGAPMVLRIGGRSADNTYWQPAGGAPPPRGVSRIGTNWMSRLGELVRRTGTRVMLDLNLPVHSPAMEGSFVQAAIKALPPGSVVGLEIGNEPDEYWRQPSLTREFVPSSMAVPKDWTTHYSASDYKRDYTAYARALTTQAPGIPLGGPETISPKPAWLSGIEGLGRLDPGFITVHRYASSNCWPVNSPYYPTIPLLLNEASSAGLAQTLTGVVAYAHARHEALRVTEVNSISCGGNPGVANTFATALWAPDALLGMVKAGADSVSWQTRPNALNSPFLPDGTGIDPMPELYGLAMFAQMTRPGAELLNSTLSSTGHLHLKAWAVRFSGGMRVLLINKGSSAGNVTLNLGVTGDAYLKRLLAPRVGSETGITFGGQTIGSDGHWQGREQAPAVPGNDGVYHVAVPGYSAAMLTIWR
jgi:hypothetical protein